MITDDLIQKISWMVNLFEQDSGSKETEYDKIYIYGDGPGNRKQVTLARGYTACGGNLCKVLGAYIKNGGSKSGFFRPYLKKMNDVNLHKDSAFLTALSKAGAESAMQRAQDAVFRSAYLDPALRWAEREGFVEPLSYAVAVDSFLHSGKMSQHLRDKFTERTPAKGGREKEWMFSYLKERLAWFQRSTGPLGTCVFRPKFFLNEIAVFATETDMSNGHWALRSNGNWSLSCPLVIPEKGRICG